jgi:GNAT superfamily N-acetyltransferase
MSGEHAFEPMIRTMRGSDAAEVATLCAQLGYERTEDEVRAWIAEPAARQAAFVAVLHDEVVGWIEVAIVRHLQSAAHAMIGGLIVKDGVRGHGIGRLLCEHAERWSVQQGVEAVRVTSRSTRSDAHRFYRELGYEVVKTSVMFQKVL